MYNNRIGRVSAAAPAAMAGLVAPFWFATCSHAVTAVTATSLCSAPVKLCTSQIHNSVPLFASTHQLNGGNPWLLRANITPHLQSWQQPQTLCIKTFIVNTKQQHKTCTPCKTLKYTQQGITCHKLVGLNSVQYSSIPISLLKAGVPE